MRKVFYPVVFFLQILSIILYAILWYLKDNLGVDLNVILYTLAGPIDGANLGFLSGTVKYFLFALCILGASIVIIFLVESFFSRICIRVCGKVEQHNISIDMRSVFRGLVLCETVIAVIWVAAYADTTLKIGDYIAKINHQTTIYEDKYIQPSSVAITAPEKKKNLIFIYLESLETAYASEAVGGKQPDNNYIPNLTELAKENISFSNTDSLGGFHAATGTNWTFAAMFATSSGLPFAFPVEGNSVYKYQHVLADGTETLGDILMKDGYSQEFLCGSDGAFAGRKQFYERHGQYEVFDYYKAIEKGYIPEDYFEWWGLEDRKLYQIAKDELIRLSEQDKPFNLTMLTVDTHYTGGYICEICKDTYPDRTANVVACADNQINDFVAWCKEQSFYEDTAIVIIGDHPCMDNYLCEGIPYYDRTVYNCFINAEPVKDAHEYHFREFTSMDIFPTILSAMGYDIDGDRLGLGTDLFSGRKTLAEEMGYDEFDKEISGYSEYYIERFR